MLAGTRALILPVLLGALSLNAQSLAFETQAVPAGTVNVEYVATLQATGGIGGYAYSLNSGQLPPGLSLSNGGVIQGLPTTAGSYLFTIRLQSGAESVLKTFNLNIASNTGNNLTITTLALPQGTIGQGYQATVTAAGGTSPYSYQIVSGSGALPNGISFVTSGQFLGTPNVAGTYTFTVRVTDTLGAIYDRTLTIVVNSNVLAVATLTLPNASRGLAYNSSLAASGGTPPYSFGIVSGALPAGLSLSTAGNISGTVAPNATLGASNFRVRVTDGINSFAERDLSIIVVAPALSINLGPLSAAIRNASYAHTFTATGGTGSYTFSLFSGSLPNGLTLNANGLLNGTPTVLGIFPFVVRVTDGANNTSNGSFTLSVNATALTITPTTLPAGALNISYSTTLGATGGTAPYSFSLSSGTLPPGLSLSTGGVLSGSPTQAGTFQFTVGVVDSASISSTAAVSITIAPSSIVISTSALAIGQTGLPYNSSISATGGTPPYTFTLVNGSLPPGLTLFASGAITGTPSLAGSFNFTVRVNDTINAFAEQQITLTVASSGITIVTPALPNGVLNTAYSASIAVSGGLAPYQFQVNSGQLPPGLFLNQNTGAITGTPTLSGSYPFTIRVTDNFNASALANYAINVGTGAITIQPSSLANATPGVPYNVQLTASGGSGSYNYALLNGQLPPGLSLGLGGLISGTPTVSGVFNFTVQVTDGASAQAQFPFTLNVTSNALTIVNTTLPTGRVGTSYSGSFFGTGGVLPYTWSIPTGSLPQGLTMNSDGLVSGTPNIAGQYSFTVRLRDQNNTSVEATANIQINNTGTLTITTTTLPTAQATVFYNQQLSATGGTPGYTWILTNGQFPPGISMSTSGLVSGTPINSGIYSFSVQATDTQGLTTATTLTINVSASGLAILTSSLPQAAIGQSYQTDLTATGGTPPYAFNIQSGQLPTGLTLNSAGRLSGIPSVAGAYPLTFRVVDAASNSAQTSLTLNVGSSLLSFVTSTLPNATAGVLYDFSVQASGGTPPYVFSIASGAFPAGITMGTDGRITGTATTTAAVNLSLRVTDQTGASVTQPYFFAVGQTQLVFSNGVPPSAVIGQAYSFTFSATGGITPYQYSVVNGAVPTGLTLSSGGVLSGIPTQTGGFGFTLRAVDANNAFVQFGYSINVAPSVFSFTTQSLPQGRVGTPYSATLATTGGQAPIVYGLSQGGTFPPGLSVATNGSITGTPLTAGTYTFTAAARDSSASQLVTQTQLSIVITSAPPSFLTTSIPDGTIDVAYSTTLNATGGIGQLTFRVLSGTLPQGLTLGTGGLLSGVPRQSGAFPLTFRVTDSATNPQTADLTVTLNIAAPTPPTISDFIPASGQLHFPYTTTFFASGGRQPYAFSIDSGSLPNGLRLDSSGVLTGLLLAHGVYSFRVKVTDAAGLTATLDTTITVIGPQFLPNGQVGVGYNNRFQPNFGTGPYTVTVNNSAIGRIPEGLTLNSDGTFAGVPTAPGEYTFGLLVRDATAVFRLATASIRINPAPTGLRIPALTLPNTSVGANYNQTVVATGGSGSLSWNVRSGNLPNGLQLNPLTGVLSGIANVPGTQSFIIEVRDSQGASASVHHTMTVVAAGPPALNALVSAGSYAPGGVVPGELITIFGNTMGPGTLTTFTLSGNTIPTVLAGTRVLFDGIPAPIIYTRNDQVSAIVPWGVASKPSVRIAVEYLGVQSPPFLLPVLTSKPAIFSANASGSGPGAILNENGSVNQGNNPAAKGSVIVVYATGGGTMIPAGEDGRVAAGISSLQLPVTATVGGQAAEVLYAGNAPGLVEGVIQINLRLAANVPSGDQPVAITIGGNATTANVTVAIQP